MAERRGEEFAGKYRRRVRRLPSSMNGKSVSRLPETLIELKATDGNPIFGSDDMLDEEYSYAPIS